MKLSFQKRILIRHIALLLLFTFGIELVAPLTAYALTSGPSTPEVQSFEPAGTSEMVDMFTGDFNYNIPLFELPGPNGGYPFNLSYHAGVSMEQEASWAGQGWNVNAGAINRDVRGYADDFNGDEIKSRQDLKTNYTIGVRGGANFELFGADFSKGTGGKNGGISLGLSLYYNSYKGIGYSLEPGINYHGSGSKTTSGLGLNISMDSQEGAGLRPSLTIGDKKTDADNGTNSMSLSLGINSRRGLTDVGFGFNLHNKGNQNKTVGGAKSKTKLSGNIGTNSTISFASTAYAPSIDMPMSGSNAAFTFKAGYAESALLSSWYVGGYYSEQHLQDKNKEITKKAYGYSNFERAGKADLTDFNREKDGMIRDQSPNLAIPNMTYDAYSILGQGVGGMFRPYRSNVVALYDPFKRSMMGGGAGSFEWGMGTTDVPHFGIDASVNVCKSNNGPWEDFDNANFSFSKNSTFGKPMAEFEPTYFKILGESTIEQKDNANSYYSYIGGDAAVSPLNSDIKTTSLVNKRVPRNSVVQPLSNKQIHKGSPLSGELFPEYVVNYYGSANLSTGYKLPPGTTFDRTFGSQDYKDKRCGHAGAYSILQADGSRYIYALPVYNNKQVDAVYSCNVTDKCAPGPIPNAGNADKYHRVSGTDGYLNKVITPAYTTSHLLTGIQGADYVDVDNNGPSDDDFGYWVKFNYVKNGPNDYKWKSPYEDANLMIGNEYRKQDDKAAYTYGEKEMYYLATAETKTHIAVFKLKPRKDGMGVSSEYQKYGDAKGNVHLYRIDKIELYEKSDYRNSTTPKAITTVNFGYSYELCKGLRNFDSNLSDPDIPGNDDGKLTLKKLSFSYEHSTRGALNPYVFTYNTLNPNYDKRSVDRWGNYKNYGTVSALDCKPYDFPYVKQDGSASADAQAWNLASIQTPSGSTIKVSYESDDYGYVQNKVATRMFKIAGLSQNNQNLVYPPNGTPDGEVIFNLDRKISTQQELKAYIKDLKTPEGNYQLYYKVRIKLRTFNEPLEEYITGYATFGENAIRGIGTAPYTKAAVKLDLVKGYHPFALSAWQFMRVNMPDEFDAPGKLSTKAGSDQDVKDKALQLLSAITSIRNLFTDYRGRCKRQTWASRIDLENSWIRLNVPDKKKYGGGLRVKQITIEDNWDAKFEGSAHVNQYGVTYDYSAPLLDDAGNQVLDDDGKAVMMSTGVAQYEPIIGGDEIALRYSKTYPESIPLKTDNNLYFEYPVNEGYFPAPVVGYSKVTVRSLASDNTAKDITGFEGIPTTGQVVHEFYTARDFPVITEETQIDKTPFHLFVPIPFLGEIKMDQMNAKQGYKIELNDMHGKPKKITYYAQDKDGLIVNAPVSWVQYNYKCEENVTINGVKAKKLVNNVQVLNADGATPVAAKMGVDYDFFTDLRRSYTRSGQGGVSINSDVLNFFVVVIPAFVPWPNISYSETEAKLAVTNKIIHRSGILDETIAYDGGASVSTKNIYYDAQTGRPVLTKVDNNFGDPIFKYNIPAHWVYDGMGAAYKNIGFEDELVMRVFTGNDKMMYATPATASNMQLYVPGDELLIEPLATVNNTCSHTITSDVKYKGTVIKKQKNGNDEELVISTAVNITANPCGFKSTIMRSGRKNMLMTDASSIVALKDPTKDRDNTVCAPPGTTISYDVPIDIPDDWIEFWENILVSDNHGRYFPAFTADLAATNRDPANVPQYTLDCGSGDVPNTAGGNVWICTNFNYFNHPNVMGVPTTDPKYVSTGKTKAQVVWDVFAAYMGTDPSQFRIAIGHCEPLVYGDDVINGAPGIKDEYRQSAEKTTHPYQYTCEGTGNTSCGSVIHLIFNGNGGTQSSCHRYLSYGVNYGRYEARRVLGDYQYQYSGEIQPRYVTSIQRYDAKRFIINFEDGENPIISQPLFPRPTTGQLCDPNVSVSCSINKNNSTIDSVISASAVKFKEEWIQTFNDVRWSVTNPPFTATTTGNNLYRSGEKGIWKPYQNFVYVKDRDKSVPFTGKLPANYVNTRMDGTFSTVPIFDWQNPKFTACFPEWKKTNTITKYNPYGHETENQDILDNYSSALYSYKGKLSTAVSTNSDKREMASEGFEEYANITVPVTPRNNPTGNFCFVNVINDYRYTRIDDYNVDFAYGNRPVLNGRFVDLTEYYKNAQPEYAKFEAEAVADADNAYEKIAGISAVQELREVSNGKTAVVLSDNSPGFLTNNPTRCWTGSVSLSKALPNVTADYNGKVEFTNELAHTGKMSMKVSAACSIPQFDLKLKPKKTYVFGAWMSYELSKILPPNLLDQNEANWGISLAYGPVNSANPTVVGTFKPSGEVIEGWRRIEGEFTTPSDFTANDVWFLVLQPSGSSPVYIDDVRLHPFDASMKSYVYDPKSFKLRAVLDDNNFATLYSYDGQGNLFLVRRETERGIMTVQETKSNIQH